MTPMESVCQGRSGAEGSPVSHTTILPRGSCQAPHGCCLSVCIQLHEQLCFHASIPPPSARTPWLASPVQNRHKPHVVTLDTIVGSTRYKNLYDYDDDQAHPQKSGTAISTDQHQIKVDRNLCTYRNPGASVHIRPQTRVSSTVHSDDCFCIARRCIVFVGSSRYVERKVQWPHSLCV